jgi:hypothetical protein
MHFKKLRFSVLLERFAVCRLPREAEIPAWATRAGFLSVTRSAEELSIVCSVEHVPLGIKAESPWVCLQIEGPFAFDQVGILASFINPLAARGVAIFAISTFDTDFVLVKQESLPPALDALREAGHVLVNEGLSD